MKIAIAGGGTAGHVFPALAVAEILRAEHGADVVFLGTADGLEARLVPPAGFEFHVVRAAPLRRELSVATARAPLTAVGSIKDCVPVVADAQTVVGTGGYVSVPAVLAGVRTKTPIVLHEQNAVPGLANRLLSRFADLVALTFEEARTGLPRRAPTLVVGNPVRASILKVPAMREELARTAQERFGLDGGRTTVLIFGGSQGALRIDRAAAGAAEHLADRQDLQLLVLTGREHENEVPPADGTGGVRVVVQAFVEEMELAYAAADVVIARAGATTIAELTACGLPSILIPYPHATGHHQHANALAVQRAGAASILDDDDLSDWTLAARIRELAEDVARRTSMAAAAAAMGRPDAGARLAAEVVRLSAEEAA